jgi:hypothetical protein
MAGNVLRGALGNSLRAVAGAEDYARIFRPSASGSGPSGLAHQPRPFVIRCAALNGRIVQPGEQFCFGLHLFDTREPVLDLLIRAFGQWAEVASVERSEVSVDLSPRPVSVARVRVGFQTPTELKAAARGAAGGVAGAARGVAGAARGVAGAVRRVAGKVYAGDFSVLLARARDRVSTLRGLYGEGPLTIDFRGLAERARSVTTVRSELRYVAVERRSRGTGQRHGIGGWIGFAEYAGDLAEFLPYLEAAAWTGVGRHCTWGNGQIDTTVLNSDRSKL